MAALGGSRHALINLSTQIDIPPIIKKSLFSVTGYSGHEDEQLHHLNTSYVSLAPVCALQTGAFCIFFKTFFKKSLKNNVHFGLLWFEGLRKGTFQNPPLSRQRKEVRT